MRADTLLKGCFLWSILFLLFGCSEEKAAETIKANPKDCEWYVVPESPLNGGTKNRLDMYALRLYADNSYTFCADLLFETGTWSYDEEKQAVVLKCKQGEGAAPLRYVVDEKKKEKTLFRVYHQYPFNEAGVDEMVEVRAISNQSDNDPYNSSLHEWRKKPAAAESAEQIKTKVMRYLRFLEVLYVHAIDNSLENAGGRWYPQPLQFYSNKVRMAYAEELEDWYNCFYNEAQGIKAYQLLSGALMKVNITGNDNNSRNLNCVRQLIANL
jgi:hypothetical protein